MCPATNCTVSNMFWPKDSIFIVSPATAESLMYSNFNFINVKEDLTSRKRLETSEGE